MNVCINIPQFCIHSTVDGNFSGLYHRAIMSNTIMNILVRVFSCKYVCVAVGYISKRRIAASQGKYTLSFSR